MKKKVISTLLAVIMLFSFYVLSYAEGDPNIDGGGGELGSGTSSNFWSPGMDGVRVSVVNVETGIVMGTPIDYTNKNPSLNYHFGNISKIQYRNGTALSPTTSAYQYRNPSPALPIIVSSDSNNNVEAIKKYFCSEGAAKMIANDFGIDFDTLISGQYKLFLEPVVYFTFEGQMVGMTAHEAALYDQQLSGGLRSKMAPLTHQNLPLSMFLERQDLGFPVFNGDTTSQQSNDTILSYLGMGTVTYTEEEPPEPSEYDIEYRINTEVITSVTLNAMREINPDAPATVTFEIMVRFYTMSNIVIPENESQVVWVKWTTPDTEQTITITVETNRGYLSENLINANIVDLDKNPPPDPKADDRNNSFSEVSPPNRVQRTTARWTVWWAEWYPFWEWEADWQWVADVRWVSNWYWVSDWYYDDYWGWYDYGYWRDYGYWYDFGQWFDFGEWVDNGWYNFFTDIYTANFTASSRISPDVKVPTASGNTMKSGYGVNNTVTSSLTSNAPNSHITGAQNAVSYFSEFRYVTYWRLLDRMNLGFSASFEFKQNQYSTYNQRSHFTPVWYPNGAYNVYTWLIDAWTPAGMLSMNLNDSVNIQGSVFDDWHIAPKN